MTLATELRFELERQLRHAEALLDIAETTRAQVIRAELLGSKPLPPPVAEKLFGPPPWELLETARIVAAVVRRNGSQVQSKKAKQASSLRRRKMRLQLVGTK